MYIELLNMGTGFTKKEKKLQENTAKYTTCQVRIGIIHVRTNYSLREVLRLILLLLSLSGTKQAMPLLAPLMREVNQVVVTRAEPLRSRDPHEVMAELCRALPGLAVECVPDPEQALVHALRLTPPEGLLCATGSMYAAGFARRLLREGLARRAAA